MRESKFRGIRLDTGAWAHGSVINNAFTDAKSGEADVHIFDNSICDDYDSFPEIAEIIEEFCKVDSKTVGEFTGLLDKNGVAIYEGDVVCHPWGYSGDSRVEGGICKVEWLQEHNESGFWISDLPDGCSWDDCEVIGNIHQNPELLEQK